MQKCFTYKQYLKARISKIDSKLSTLKGIERCRYKREKELIQARLNSRLNTRLFNNTMYSAPTDKL